MYKSQQFDKQLHSNHLYPCYKVEVALPNNQVIGQLTVQNAAMTLTRSGGVITRSLTLSVLDDIELTEVTNGRTWHYGEDGDTYGGMGGYYGPYSITDVLGVLQPYGVEVRVYRGLEIEGYDVSGKLYRTPEYKWIGTLPIVDTDYSDEDGTRVITVTTNERSTLISKNSWKYPITGNWGSYSQHAKDIFSNRTPPYWRGLITLNSTATDNSVAPVTIYGGQVGRDPWADIIQLNRIVGQVVEVQGDGVFVMHKAPELRLDGPADVNLTIGEQGLVVSGVRRFKRSQSFNSITVQGGQDAQGNPVFAEASDSFAYSAMSTLGPVGIITKNIPANNITDPVVAQDLANRLGQEYFGLYEEIEVTMIPDPTIEMTDVLHVNYPPLGINAKYYISSMTMPVSDLGGLMTMKLLRHRAIEEDRALQQEVGTMPERGFVDPGDITA